MNDIWAIARLDLAVWRRTPWAIAAAVIPPLGMALLIATLTFSAGKQPVALVVLDTGTQGQIMAKIIKADTEAYKLHVTDIGHAQRLLADQLVAGVIVIPADFDQQAYTGKASLNLTLNNVDIDFGDDIRRAVDRSVAEFDAPQLGASVARVGITDGLAVPNPYRVDVLQNNLRTTNVSFLRYQTVPVLLLLIINVGVLGGALLGTRDHERGTMTLLRLTPIAHWRIVVGRLTGTTLATGTVLVPAVLVLTATGLVRPPAGHWPAFVGVLAATTLFASGIGVILGVGFRRSANVAIAAVIVSSFLFFLGGGFTTIAFLPRWLELLSRAVPTRYGIDALHQTLFYPDLRDVGTNLVGVGAFALASVAVGARIYGRGSH